MSKFHYRAKNKSGQLITGEIEASDPWLARKALLKSNLIVMELGQYNSIWLTTQLRKVIEGLGEQVSLEEKMTFVGQLEMGFSVGIPIIQVLEMAQQEMENKFLKQAIQKVVEDVNQGEALHRAFSKHPTLFDDLFVSMVRTGELTGELEKTLARIGQLVEQQFSNRAKVKSAVFYPKIVVVVMILALIVVVYFVIPKIKAFLASFGQDLPWITRMVVGVSDFFVGYWYLIFGSASLMHYQFNRYIQTPTGRFKFDQLKLKIPGICKIFLNLELNNFCIILEILVSSGIPLVEALETLKNTQSNSVFSHELTRAKLEIEKGSTLSKSLASSQVFPTTVKSLVATGDESGRLPEILARLGKYYQVQLNYQLDNLSKLIEPILLGVIFVMVLILALAIFLPIWKMSSAVKSGH